MSLLIAAVVMDDAADGGWLPASCFYECLEPSIVFSHHFLSSVDTFAISSDFVFHCIVETLIHLFCTGSGRYYLLQNISQVNASSFKMYLYWFHTVEFSNK